MLPRINLESAIQRVLTVQFLLGFLVFGTLRALPLTSAAKDALHPESYTFEESFNSYAYKAYARDMEWDIWASQLTLMPQDTITQERPAIAASSGEGAYVVWVDHRNGGSRIYAQRLDSAGNRHWERDAQVSMISSTVWQEAPAVVIDDTGAAIIAWSDDRIGASRVYLQRLDRSGRRTWPEDIAVAEETSSWQSEPALMLDNTGDIVVAWSDLRSGTYHILARKMSVSGGYVWPNDVQVSGLHHGQYQLHPLVVPDGRGGSLIAWEDAYPRDYLEYVDIYVQHLNGQGDRLWAQDRAILSSDEQAIHHTLAAAQAGDIGLTLAWVVSGGSSILIKHVQEQVGSAPSSSVIISDNTPSNIAKPAGAESAGPFPGQLVGGDPLTLATDGAGGVFLAWSSISRRPDGLGFSEEEIYALRLDAGLTALWSSPVLLHSPQPDTLQQSPMLASDGQGGVWASWEDRRRARGDIYVQRLSGSGIWQWPNEIRCHWDSGQGRRIASTTVLDQNGAAWVAWAETRHGNNEVYLQQIGVSGQREFPYGLRASATGITDNQDSPFSQYGPRLAIGNDGHLLAAWWDTRDDSGDTYAQKLDLNGNRLWTTDKLLNHESYDYQASRLALTSDCGEGYFVAWTDNRSGLPAIRVQHISSDGELLWPGDVMANEDRSWVQHSDAFVVCDESDGVFVAWWDNRAAYREVYVQRLNAKGQRLWLQDTRASAVPGSGYSEDFFFVGEPPALVADGTGGVFVAWNDARDGGTEEIYLQRISSAGVRLWTSDREVSRSSIAGNRFAPYLGRSGSEIRIAWQERRNASASSGIYLQKIDRDGNVVWPADVPIGEDTGKDKYEPTIVMNPAGGTLAVWSDYRNDVSDVYLQLVNSQGSPIWEGDIAVMSPQQFVAFSGVAESKRINPPGIVVSHAALAALYENRGGSIEFYLSNDGGTSWWRTEPGQVIAFPQTGSDLRWRVEMHADPQSMHSPTIDLIRISYESRVNVGDAYEPDDACAAARPIAVNGAAQDHTFHQQSDADWAWFDANAGVTYIVETRNIGAHANTVIEPYATCTAPPTSGGRAFGPGYTISFAAPSSGRYYLKVYNHDPAAFGEDTAYTLSVRAVQPSAVAVIVAGHDNAYSAQENIIYAADRAYRIFRNAGIPTANIHYLAPLDSHDADGDAINDVAGPPTVANVRDAVQDWARERGVALGMPFYLYLVDHGLVDHFKADGDAADRHVTAIDLNLWLSNLEATTGADNVNVIIDACYSGSFIDVTAAGPATISGRNRVVIASTTSDWLAFGPPGGQGLYFSNAFFSALENEQSLYASYLAAWQSLETQDLLQRPWLDDNGDRCSDTADGALASDRALRRVALGGQSPHIEWVQGNTRTGQILARISDDSAQVCVRVEVFAPSYVPPQPDGSGTTRIINVPVVALNDPDGDDVYTGMYSFTESGSYRLVAHAQDSESNLALPVTGLVGPGSDGVQLHLPLVLRGP